MKMRDFGVRLSHYRERQKLSITQLAKLLGVDYMSVYRYEKGQTLPSLETALRLANVLQISLEELAGSEPPQPPVFQNQQLLERMRQLDQIPPERQELALRVLDTVIAGYELEDLGRRLGRS